ncbi:MAG: aminotransferase class I/II-fold pyridoxal phosphate-dependent enzyme [Bacteroidaceae bacterium]|nr:aminotransferase class I/II-fold pyridoxal phosphate-dependent enzyme [Bacteroidaceae bacterium]
MSERKRIYLCLAHMSEEGWEQKYVKEAFDTNWVVPLGPNVNAFEEDLERFIAYPRPLPEGKGVRTADPMMYKLLKEQAERMRKNPTEVERILWNALKTNATGLHFRRQHIIQDFIVDFFCYDKMLTIELDGGYHETEEQKGKDQYRTSELKCLGYTELRFKNEEVIGNLDGAISKIKHTAMQLPSLQGGAGGRPVVALSSGTAAVHLGLLACGVGPGDEVLVQSFTFCASTHPITYLGATPVMVDSEPETWNMDPQLLEEAIKDRIAKTGKKPKAIVPVYLYGMPAKIDEIMAIANKYEIPVVEDAAEGFGSCYHGQVCGTFGEYGVLSFNGNKMITTSGGGALICSSLEAKNKIMWYATQAREAYPYYQHEAIGYNYRLSNVCAGIGRGQMKVVDEHIARHRQIAAMYEEAFRDFDGIEFHKEMEGTESNYWLNTILLDENLKVKNEELAYAEAVKGAVGGAAGVVHGGGSVHTDCEPNVNVEAMRLNLDKAGIESRPLWKPMHKQPVYRNVPAYVNGVSESLFKRGLCLPSGPMVTDEDVELIIRTIKECVIR